MAETGESEVYLEKEGKKVNAKSILGLLMLAIGEGNVIDIITEGEGEEEEDQTEDEMFGGSDDDSMEDLDGSSEEDEDPFKESVDSEELGHAIVKDLDKGHLTSKKSNAVKGAVPVSKKSSSSSSIKGADGKIEKHSTDSAISKLTGKNNNVGGVKVGKGLFDQ